MTHATRSSRLPLRLRLFTALQREPDWSAMSPEELAEYSDARNRAVASPPARLLTGLPDRAATIDWQRIDLPDRSLPVRVYRRSPRRGDPETDLPLVLHVHGGGSTGTAVQCDWLNGHIAARLPAVVVSVEHRLVAPDVPISAAVDDGWDALRHVVHNAASRRIDPSRTAVVGESAGALIAALLTVRASASRLPLRSQVLVNPCVDLTSRAFDHRSMTEFADSPTLTVEQIEYFIRLAGRRRPRAVAAARRRPRRAAARPGGGAGARPPGRPRTRLRRPAARSRDAGPSERAPASRPCVHQHTRPGPRGQGRAGPDHRIPPRPTRRLTAHDIEEAPTRTT